MGLTVQHKSSGGTTELQLVEGLLASARTHILRLTWARVSLVVCAVAVLALSLAPSASADGPNVMAYVDGTETNIHEYVGEWEYEETIYIAELDGEHAKTVITGLNKIQSMALSPSGYEIAFTEATEPVVGNGHPLEPKRIQMVDSNGENRRTVYECKHESCYVANVRFSPSGNRLIFDELWNHEEGAIDVTDVDGDGLETLRSGDAGFALFSPNENEIAFWRGGVEQIDLMNSIGSNTRDLIQLPHWGFPPSVEYSPNGKELILDGLYTRDISVPEPGLFFASASTGSLTHFEPSVSTTGGEGPTPEAIWSAQDNKIAYYCAPKPSIPQPSPWKHAVCRMNPDGSEDEVILPHILGPIAFPQAHSDDFEEEEQQFGGSNPSNPYAIYAHCGDPVSCATGNFTETQNDFSIGGRGIGLGLSRTYNSLEAAASKRGIFGYGWSNSFGEHLSVEKEEQRVTLHQTNGSTVQFAEEPGGTLVAPSWTQDTLSANSEGYLLTLTDQSAYRFNKVGRLESVTEANGNTTSLSYNANGQLEKVTDPSGRTLTFSYDADGLVETVTDPMGYVVKYGYDNGDLTSVTEPGDPGPRWRFEYDSSHRMTSMTNAQGGLIVNEYDELGRVVAQTMASGAHMRFSYEPGSTTITNLATGGVTKEAFTEQLEPESITHGYGSSNATTESFTYNKAGDVTSITNGDGHKTEYSYDGEGNRTAMRDADGDVTKWAYNSHHFVTSETRPSGETTYFDVSTSGDILSASRTAPGGEEQATKYGYNADGELTSMTNPLGRTWKYGYNGAGDRTSETDPEGNARTWEYNKDSQEVATVSPRGNAAGAEASEYTTTIERDAQGRPVAVIEPEPASESAAAPAAPSNTAAPTISGVAKNGDTLEADVGTWEGSPPLTYTYQWQSCDALGGGCLAVPGATSSRYVLSEADVGAQLQVVVTATSAAGSTSSTSAATATVMAGALTAPLYSYASQFPGAGEFKEPEDMAIDSKGDLWVADTENDRIVEFNEEGEYVRQFGSEGSGEGQFDEPDGVAVNVHGDVWVLDSGNARLQEFTEEGKYIRTVGSEGFGEGQFSYPEGIFVDSHGNVWVSDTYNGRVEEFNEEGQYIKAIGTEGEGSLSEPEGLAVDSRGDVWVADWTNKVVEFNEEGEYVRQFGSEGGGDGEFDHPYGLTIDQKGDVWVSDQYGDRIEEFSDEGTYVGQCGVGGGGPGQFNIPLNLASDAKGDIWVADAHNSRVEEFNEKCEYLASQNGGGGSKPGQLEHPGAIAQTAEGDLWVADTSNDRVEEFSPAGEYLAQFGTEGSGPGELKEPSGLAINSHGDIWVLDAGNDRIQEFNEKGEYIRALGSKGSGAGQLEEPEGITVDAHGDVWVSDTGNGRVEEFSEEGAYIKSIGSKGPAEDQLEEPKGVAVDAGNVWVSDRQSDQIKEFNEEGEFIKAVGSLGSGDGQFDGPGDIAVDAEGNLWVGDIWNGRIEEFNVEGEYLGQFGEWGAKAGQFSFEEPMGLVVGANGEIWATDTGNDRVEQWTSLRPPSDAIVPSITGQAVEGQTLHARAGAWSGTPTITYTYQWQRCNESGTECHSIEGAAGSSYTLTAGDVGKKLQVLVTASNEEGSATASPVATPVVVAVAAPANTASPTVAGLLQEQQTLSASPGTWTAAPSPTYAYQWQRCNSVGESCTNITGASSATHVLGHSDVEHTLRIVVTATNPAGSASSTSAATTAIAALHRETRYSYDADGNLASVTEPGGRATSYTYNADNEPTKIQEPNGTTTETGYNAAGEVVRQTDGNGHTTKYVRNVLGEVTEIINPLHQKTTEEYDDAGNLIKLTDPAKRTTTYTYDPASRLTEVSYSDGSTPDVKYEYNAEGNPTSMTDGTGTTTYTYDQLGRLTETKDGRGATTGYEYNLANEQTKITYPNGKAVEYAYDNDGRMHSLTDWLGHTITFTYDPDSNLTATTFPSGTGEEDLYTYDENDQITGVEMKQGTETLASIAYQRNNENQLTNTISKNLPGEEETEDTYDANGRLTKAGASTYAYDPANNPTTTPGSINTYNAADELEKSTNAEYTYNELGQRTKSTPDTGPATNYGWDQAGNLTAIERPEEGSTPKIQDTYTYNGDGLRTSETINGTTHQLTWQQTGALPLLLSDESNSYIYGPKGMPVEQINNKEEPTYLHHDQAGSTRLLTNEKGESTGAYTYGPYGETTGHTGTATTLLGYDGQYTSPDTGLIYMRAREYDPATAQFLSVDPEVASTHEPYAYGQDNPLTYGDPTGESIFGEFVELVENLNPIKYYEAEIKAYESGCGYWQSVWMGIHGAGSAAAIVGALDDGGEGDYAGDSPTGQRGSPMNVPSGTNTPAEIDGISYTGHAFDEMQSEGLTPSVVKDAIQNGQESAGSSGRVAYYSPENNISVVTEDGRVITVTSGRVKIR